MMRSSGHYYVRSDGTPDLLRSHPNRGFEREIPNGLNYRAKLKNEKHRSVASRTTGEIPRARAIAQCARPSGARSRATAGQRAGGNLRRVFARRRVRRAAPFIVAPEKIVAEPPPLPTKSRRGRDWRTEQHARDRSRGAVSRPVVLPHPRIVRKGELRVNASAPTAMTGLRRHTFRLPRVKRDAPRWRSLSGSGDKDAASPQGLSSTRIPMSCAEQARGACGTRPFPAPRGMSTRCLK